VLDMSLAEKGGVCVLLGGKCCTFIPNNTAPSGTFKKALQQLMVLADASIHVSFNGW
jgi:hypothetical protein